MTVQGRWVVNNSGYTGNRFTSWELPKSFSLELGFWCLNTEFTLQRGGCNPAPVQCTLQELLFSTERHHLAALPWSHILHISGKKGLWDSILASVQTHKHEDRSHGTTQPGTAPWGHLGWHCCHSERDSLTPRCSLTQVTWPSPSITRQGNQWSQWQIWDFTEDSSASHTRTGTGVGPGDPWGSLSTQGILWFYGKTEPFQNKLPSCSILWTNEICKPLFCFLILVFQFSFVLIT